MEGGPIADVKLIPANCPNCGASLKIPDGLEKAFCTYCGTEILIAKISGTSRVPCRVCNGLGKVDYCKACDGSGRCAWSTNSPGGRRDILMIGYSSYCSNGVCSACNGTGRYNIGYCPGCEGTGRCPRCLGTGKCLACHGLGVLPNPNGTNKCAECGGTGFIDPAAPSPMADGSMCPECKRPWAEGQTVCPHCGYKRNLCPGCGAVWIIGSLSCSKCGFGKY